MSGKLDLLVIGGLLVIDHIAVLRELPAPGETALFPGLTAALDEQYFGGNNVNLAAAAAALGLRVGLISFTGADFQSSGYRDYLDRVGITDRWLQVLDGQPIAHCYSFFDEGGASLTFMDYPAATAGLELAVPKTVVESARQTVIIGGRRDDLSAGKVLEFAATAHNARVPVALAWAGDKSSFEPRYFDLADTLLCNHFEIKVILKCMGLRGADAIASLAPRRIFVTRGASGSAVYDEGKKSDIPVAQPCRVVDPTGAGDAYAGGVLAGLAWDKSAEICGRIGAVVASFVVEKRGCQTNLPSREQLEARYRATYLLKGFFDSLPSDLEEAAMIDGCNRLKAFYKIALPLALPGLISTALMSFIVAWDDYVFALTLITSDARRTLPVAMVGSFVGEFAVKWGEMMSVSLLMSLPVVILFVFLQKYLIQGITAGAIKG